MKVIECNHQLIEDGFLAAGYDDPKILIEAGKTLGEFLLSKGAEWFVSSIIEALGGAKAKDSIPFIGAAMNAIAAAGMVAEIAETIEEVTNSPRTYVNELTFTHDIEVTIYPAENDPNFPEVADYYELTALFDNGTPHTSGKIDLPDPSPNIINYTFAGVPYGGKVNISVGFHAYKDNWLAGGKSTGCIDNTVDSVAITIKENLIPLTSDTRYSYKDKIVLDSDGNHIWQATPTPPEETVDYLSCNNMDGELCKLTSITVSEHYGALGYSWKSYSSGIVSCDSGAHGQFQQFASLSFTEHPEDGHRSSDCGLSAPVRVVYDLMGSHDNNYYLDTTQGRNIIRQIRLQLDGKPTWDEPNSDIAWGKFNHASDAFMLHPCGKFVSINAENNKIEVLDLPDNSTTDDDARFAQGYSGPGSREGLVKGPVAAAITPKGALLILESENKRIQAFDVGVNPTPYFKGGNYHVPLGEETQSVMYLDMAVEHTGFIYVLSYVLETLEYRLDIYTPEGDFLSRTTGVNAARCMVDFWRNVYTLNYEVLKLPDGTDPLITEPSTSRWIPSVP